MAKGSIFGVALALSCRLALAQANAPAVPAAPAAARSDVGSGVEAPPPTIAPDPFKTPPTAPKTVTQKPMRTYQQMLNDLDKQVPPVKAPPPDPQPNFSRRKRVYDPQLGRYVTVDPKSRTRRYPALAPTQPIRPAQTKAKAQAERSRNADDKSADGLPPVEPSQLPPPAAAPAVLP